AHVEAGNAHGHARDDGRAPRPRFGARIDLDGAAAGHEGRIALEVEHEAVEIPPGMMKRPVAPPPWRGPLVARRQSVARRRPSGARDAARGTIGKDAGLPCHGRLSAESLAAFARPFTR